MKKNLNNLKNYPYNKKKSKKFKNKMIPQMMKMKKKREIKCQESH